jgi:hypothetical protein
MCATATTIRKPWDSIRTAPKSKPPIGSGAFCTSKAGAYVRVKPDSNPRLFEVSIGYGSDGQVFYAEDCREMADLFTELACQLDGCKS